MMKLKTNKIFIKGLRITIKKIIIKIKILTTKTIKL